ncbi:Cytochrome c oxidase subunit 2 precursor [Novipirellula galeiformis]|uniref:Cytochrome c oxidase subunit 2 n=1 Tax=Novipirellula galeiformis TaxID=2528004 RepID=A0A5C6CIE8_9BACT|nr:cytochrome c oxidase subunit II [Novipirellula galeiformis]TWU23865.1 Cytochrome c oxidase subunit 2 precursor [Novipirellula galeiformis]
MAMLPAAFSLLSDYTKDYAWFPDAASSFAAESDWLYYAITWVCVLFFVPISICLFYFAARYRKAKGAKAESQISHNTPIELIWSIGPSIFMVGMFVMGARVYLDMRTIPEGANELGIQSSKWSWSVDYGRGTYHPELHLLVDEPVKLTMQSSDVIHSLFIPAFRAKKDIVPGRYNYMWFHPTKVTERVSDEELAKAQQWTKESATEWDYDKWQFTPDGYKFYDLYCAEYCGQDHSEMQTVVVVHETREDLDAWIKQYSSRGNDTLEGYGEKLYARRGCAGCHTVDGTSATGPTYKDSFGNERELVNGEKVQVDENYIRESILNPKAKVAAGFQPVMPSYKGQLSDDDLDSLIAYIKSLSSKGEVAAEVAPAADSETKSE